MTAVRAVLLATFFVAVPAATRAQAPTNWPAFTRAFQAYVDSDRVVGASVVFVRDGRVAARYDAGMQDRAAGVRVDSQTIYHWGSITKSLTAISIMQLRDRVHVGAAEDDDVGHGRVASRCVR